MGVSPPQHVRADRPFEAAEYFREQRMNGPGALPVERYTAAQRHARAMRRAALREPRFDAQMAGEPQAGLGSWKFLGPGNVGGRTRGILVHPREPDILWAAGATGGIWKTTDGGQSWRPVTDFAPVLSISALVMDPQNPDIIYAGTGEQTQNWRGAGIYKTTDGGETWSQLPSTATPDFYFVNNVAVSREAGSRIYAATGTGVWASVDGGASWSLTLASLDGGAAPTLTGGTTHGCYDVALMPGPPAEMVFAVCHPPGSLDYAVYRNTDAAAGGTWELVHSEPKMWYTRLALAPSQPGTIYAVSVLNDGTSPYHKALLGVYRSTAGGAPGTWITRTSNRASDRLNTAILSIDSYYTFSRLFCTGPRVNYGGQAGYNLTAVVDPLDADRLWVGAVGLFRSDDGGVNWGSASGGVHPDHHGLAFHPAYDGAENQVLYNVNDGGIYKTTQARGAVGTCGSPASSVRWTSLNNSYGTTQFYHGVPYPGGAFYFGGTQDNGTVRGMDARGLNQWDYIYGGDGGVSRIDPADASTVFVEYVHGAIAKSTDGGNTYRDATAGLDEDPLNFPFVAWYTFDPSNSRRMYVGGTRLWRTEDGAEQWTAASAQVDQPEGRLDNIRSIAVSPFDPNLVLFGVRFGRIFRHDDALATAGETVWAYTQPRVGNVSHLEFDPNRPGTVYATYTTFNSAAGDQHIYRSTDGGLTWTGIDGTGETGLPDIPVQTLLVDPDDSQRLYAGTDLGLFVSFDGGGTWQRGESPFANAITTNLAIERNGGTKYLFAFTYGRGVWRTALEDGGACSYIISPESINANPAGETIAVGVTTTPGCVWSVSPAVTVSNAFASADAPAFAAGSGTATITVAPNSSTAARTMTLLVQDRPLVVTQRGR
jgi:photosystem II stability/assembly factor-like uncharacterized protein